MSTSGTSKSLEGLIPIINRLQDVFNTVGFERAIELPQIVVVGSQSSGKSSVLEGIVGRDFLPRGTGIVTRVPLVMQLIHTGPNETAPDSSNAKEWGTFVHAANKIFTDFDEIRKEIDIQTVRLVGDKKNLADKPINLKIYSPHVLNLTMVDLPGITRNPVGDQPKDIETQINQLILKYISNPKSIILAVSAANVDLATSDSIKIAREVDPSGTRTIGVLTKLDLMDKGTDATDMLAGRVIPLQLGIVGVVNRSQDDINNRKSVTSAATAEEAFFASQYPTMKHRCGKPFLAKTLSKLLMHHIRDSLPELKSRIQDMQMSTIRQLEALGEPIHRDVDSGGLLLRILTSFSQAFNDSIEGRTQVQINSHELVGGAMICHIFHNTYAHSLQNIGAMDGLTIEDIQATIRNATGTRPTLFVPESAFEKLVKNQIKRLKEPALRCVELVHLELERILNSCIQTELSRFRGLRERVHAVSENLVKERLPGAISMVENLIAIEIAYINTNHKQFEGGSGAMVKMLTRLSEEMQESMVESTPARGRPSADTVNFVQADTTAMGRSVPPPPKPNIDSPEKTPSGGSTMFGFPWSFTRQAANPTSASPNSSGTGGVISTPTADDFRTPRRVGQRLEQISAATYPTKLSNKEQMEIEIVRSLIESYFGIVRDKILDSVPKAIMHLLVNHVQNQLQTSLVAELWRPEHFAELLEEDTQVAEQRERTVKLKGALNRAMDIVTEVSVL